MTGRMSDLTGVIVMVMGGHRIGGEGTMFYDVGWATYDLQSWS